MKRPNLFFGFFMVLLLNVLDSISMQNQQLANNATLREESTAEEYIIPTQPQAPEQSVTISSANSSLGIQKKCCKILTLGSLTGLFLLETVGIGLCAATLYQSNNPTLQFSSIGGGTLFVIALPYTIVGICKATHSLLK